MKFIRCDKELLQSLRPMDISHYLRVNGWKHIEDIESKGAVWRWHNQAGEQAEILLPLDKSLSDFANRMADLLHTLEAVEQRSRQMIINDLFTVNADLLRFRIISPDTGSGTVPLPQAVALTKGVEDLLLSAACSALRPRAYFPKRTINEARNYLQKCRMGQSERGSFILTVLSPVPPLFQSSLFQGYPDYEEEPFERKVVLTLLSGLFQVKRALMGNNTAEELEKAVASGVSANLCEALKMMQPETESDELEINVSWARSRPVRSGQVKTIRFTPDIFPLLEESARYLKQFTPLEDFEVRGLVRKLEKAGGPGETGKITVHAPVNERNVNIIIDLKEKDYQLAIEAHKKYIPIYCVGELLREGKTYRLLNPRDLRIEEEI